MKEVRRRLWLWALAGFSFFGACTLVRGAELIAYSLQQAQRRLTSPSQLSPEVATLGGMTKAVGLVYDPQTSDLIVIGETTPSSNPMKLDDLVVAFRAILVHRQCPLVSIDKTPETNRTGEQTVRFEGGIANTQFGADLLAADVVLKRLALGELSSREWKGRAYFDLLAERARKGLFSGRIGSRFWFYPMNIVLAQRPGVFVIKERLRVGVRTQVLSVNGRPVAGVPGVRDLVGDRFAASLTARFDEASSCYPELARLQPLYDAVAIATGVASLEEKPDLTYWLREYQVPTVHTPETYPLEAREEAVGTPQGRISIRVAGGIELRALVLRVCDGDVSALRELVLKSRPDPEALAWPVPVGEWRAPGYALGEGGQFASGAESVQSSDRKYGTLGCVVDAAVLPSNARAMGELLPSLPTASVNAGIPPVRFVDGLRPSPTAMQAATAMPGGVLLDQTAKIENLDGVHIEGLVWDAELQEARLILKGKLVSLPKSYLDDFVAVLRTVYAGEEPGVSIDPGPTRNKMVVRYIGRVRGTRLGWTMFEADRLLKAYSLGRDNITGYPVRPPVPGFKNMIELCEEKGLRYNGAMYRFWFVPLEVRLKRAGDAVMVESVKIGVKTEYMMTGLRHDSEPAAKAFAEFFTTNYERFAEVHPVFRDLLEYAKLVGIAKYLRERGVPINWFVLANSAMASGYDTPATTPGYTVPPGETGGLEIWGGVDLDVTNTYAMGWDAVPMLVGPVMTSYRLPFSGPSPVSSRRGRRQSGLASVTFHAQGVTYTSLHLPAATRRSDGSEVFFQTDAVVLANSKPVLELTRFYDSSQRASGDFGKGWHLLVPVGIQPVGRKVSVLNAEVPEKVAVVDRVNNCREILCLGQDQSGAIGYFPQGDSRWEGAYLVSNGSLRLVDCWRDEFHFDRAWRLMGVDMGAENRWAYHYNGGRIVAITTLPSSITPAGEVRTLENLGICLPEKMAVIDGLNGECLTLSIQAGGAVSYFPSKLSHWNGLYVNPDGTFVLKDCWGNTYHFDEAGQFVGMESAQAIDGGLGGRAIRFIRDEQGRIVEATVGENLAVSFWYDAHGRLVEVMHEDGTTQRYEYDWRGRLRNPSAEGGHGKIPLYVWAIVILGLIVVGAAVRRMGKANAGT